MLPVTHRTSVPLLQNRARQQRSTYTVRQAPAGPISTARPHNPAGCNNPPQHSLAPLQQQPTGLLQLPAAACSQHHKLHTPSPIPALLIAIPAGCTAHLTKLRTRFGTPQRLSLPSFSQQLAKMQLPGQG